MSDDKKAKDSDSGEGKVEYYEVRDCYVYGGRRICDYCPQQGYC